MLTRQKSHITHFSIHRNYGFGMMIETKIFEAATLDGLTISINEHNRGGSIWQTTETEIRG